MRILITYSIILLHAALDECSAIRSEIKRIYPVIGIVPENAEQLQFLSKIYLTDDEMSDFWKPPTRINKTVYAMIHPGFADKFKQLLEEKSIPYHIEMNDFAQYLQSKHEMIPTRDKLFDKEKRLRDDSIRNSNAFLGDYHSYGEIVRWLNDLERRHRNIVKVVSIGNSTEGKIIYGVKLSAKTNKSKSAFWIDGGIHAREWVAVQTALYLIKQLITDYYSNPKVAEYLELLDVYIFPCLNPDGYEYSRSNPNEPSIRLWRKNRASPEKFEWKNGQKRYCPGVDLNRNFGFHFGESGSSPSPCSSVYHGSHAFSEPETRAVRDAILRLRQRIKAYMSLHTYSQLWIYPYSYAQNVYPPDFDDLKAVAHNAVNSIVKLYGTKYEYGTGPEVIYAYSGGSSDWVKQATSAKYSYVIELRPSKSAPNGFVVDKRELLPVGRETYEGVKVVFDKVIAEIKQKNSG